ncbi:hypothetical protein B0T18DRAFT_401165 [Schizothecium vesticola]|uniref:Uncharacterized protein n=1 Tax=Schizothecium vesticola TaxID=314040 RepID=A0AA40K9J2_9PEZI|nr:hypothetical protein B0T18DRAFT_401165 [Schizothecium vesticola]
MKSLFFPTLVIAPASLVSAVCPADHVRVTLLGGVSNEAFCQVSGSCVTMPEKWSNQMELFSMEGKTCGAFFKQQNCQSSGLEEDVFITGCTTDEDPWGRHFPRNWTRGVIKSYSVWKLE